MEQIYLGHSPGFDYKKELYEPIRESKLNSDYEVLLPYEKLDDPVESKEAIKNCKAMIAEVSYPSTGLGIEIGWADFYNKQIIFIYKKGCKVSRSLKVISSNFIEYESTGELLDELEKLLDSIFHSQNI